MVTPRQPAAGPQFDLPITATPAPVEASMSHPRAVDVTVSEWTADMSPVPLDVGLVCTTVGAIGFVDFDAVESVRTTLASTGTARR
jgi:hypothetical protein